MTDETQGESLAEAVVPADSAPAPETAETVTAETSTPGTKSEPKDAIQQRFDKITRNWREEERRREAAERRNDELIQYITQAREAKAPPPVEAVPDVMPTREALDFDEDKYQKSLIDYATKRAEAAAEAKIQAWQQQQQQAAKVESFRTREQSFAEATEDYAEVVYAPGNPVSPAMADVIRESEVGPQLAYHLAKNRELARTIHDLPPLAAARELGKLEAKLQAPATKPPPVVSKAPPPPPTIEATEPQVVKDPMQMTDAEFAKWRARQIAQRR